MTSVEFRILELLGRERLTAGEIAEIRARPLHAPPLTGRWVANQIRRLVAIGFVEGDGTTPQIYRLTAAGREYVDA